MPSSAARPRPCATCRRVRSSAPRRRAVRPWSSGCGRTCVVPLRGNVETRLRKLEAGEVDATLAGARRPEAARPFVERQRRFSTSTSFCRRSARARSASRPARTMRARARSSPRSTMPIPQRRLPPSAPSSPCSTAPAARRSAAMPASTATTVRFRGIIVKPDGSEAFEVSRQGPSRRWRRRSAPTPAANCKSAPAPTFSSGPEHAPSGDPARSRRATHRYGAAGPRSRRRRRAAPAYRTGRGCRDRRRTVMRRFSSPAPTRRRSPGIGALRNCARFPYSRWAGAAPRPCARLALPM